MAQNIDFSWFKTLRCNIFNLLMNIKCKQLLAFNIYKQECILLINVKWHFNIYEQDKFHFMLN